MTYCVIWGRFSFVASDDLDRVLLVLPRDRHDVLVGGRAEHDQFAVRPRGLDDAAYVLDEAHLEHLVGLVQHERVHLVQHDVAALHVIQQAARRGHQNLRAALERGDLPGDGLAAVDDSNAHLGDELREAAQLLGDLLGELARGREDDLLHARIAQVDVFKHRHAKAQRLARAGRRDGDDVLALHHHGNTPLLNGRQLAESHLGECPLHFFADVHLGERMDGLFFCHRHCSFVLLSFAVTSGACASARR